MCNVDGADCFNNDLYVKKSENDCRYTSSLPSLWYDDLEGVHYCETYDNLKSAVNLMENSNIPEPKIFNAHLSSTSIFIANTLPHKFSENVYKIIIEKFISSYKLFNDLDDRKWSI